MTIIPLPVPILRTRLRLPMLASADRLQPVGRASNVLMWHSPCSGSRTPLVTNRPRALVVDDLHGVREAVRLMLEALGYEAEGAASGAEALERVGQASYTVVISDLVMPGVCGWMVAEHVRLRRPGNAVVLMTGELTHEVAHRARHLGLLVLEKPFSLTALQIATEKA